MKYILIALFSLNAFAHKGHNWLNDSKAYKSVKEIKFLESKLMKKSSNIIIDQVFLKQKLSELSGATTVKIGDSEVEITERKSAKNRTNARNYLAAEYSSLGYEVSILPYGSKNTKGVKWGGQKSEVLAVNKANFIAEKIGKNSEKILIISSHLDSVGNAGANDDGSGTVAALAIAKALKDIDFEFTVRFIAFDQEELGLLGSAAYARSIPMEAKKDILGVINMEMMATNSRNDGAFHVIDCDREESQFLKNKIVQAIQSYSIELSPTSACTNRSDHASFWKRGIPAVVLSENFFGGDNDPCYHRKCDIVDDRLNFDYMAKITQAVAIATRDLLVPIN